MFDVVQKNGIKIPRMQVKCDKCNNVAKRIIYGNGTAVEICLTCKYEKFEDQIVSGHTGWEENDNKDMSIGFINGKIV